MSAADDLHRREETEAALERLLQGRQYTRKGLFSRIEKWQENLLIRMEKTGCAIAERRGAGTPTLYQVKNPDLIREILNDEERLLQMAFPSYMPPNERLELAFRGVSEADAEHEPQTDSQTLFISEVPSAFSGGVTPEMLLKIMLGLVEMVTQQSGQIALLTQQLEDQQAVLRDTHAKISKLVEELS